MSWRCLSKARRQPRSQKIAESLFAKYIRIALAIFRKFDDSYGYAVAGVKTAPVSLNSLASHFECNAHDPRRFRVKLLVASQPKPISCRPATDGCMRSSAMSFGVIARKNGAQVRLYSHPGNDLTHRFPLIVETLAQLRSRSCIIDGEAVACDDNGLASFERSEEDWGREKKEDWMPRLFEPRGMGEEVLSAAAESDWRLYQRRRVEGMLKDLLMSVNVTPISKQPFDAAHLY